MSTLHDQESRIASEAILKKWRSSESNWKNSYVSNEISFTGSSQIFPSPDNSFYDPNKRTRLAMEFKPAKRETKRGLLTGLGQSIAYLSASNNSGKLVNDASILVIPDEIDGFKIGDFLEELFKKFILDKLPIALVTFSPNNPANVSLRCNISSKLKPDFQKIYEKEINRGKNKNEAEEIARKETTFKEKEGGVTYWAYWREYYPDNAYRYLKTAAENPNKKPQEIFKIYYEKYYCSPINSINSLELQKNGMKTWDEDQVWLKSVKLKLKKLISQGKIKKIDALNRLKFEAASNQKYRDHFYEKIKDTYAGKKSKTDNNYTGIRKNLDNSMSHLDLWDKNTFNVTNDGKLFLKRVEDKKNDQVEEQAILFIGKGRWNELIKDIENFQKECPKKYLKDKKTFLKEAKNYFYEKGFISLNSKREKTATRDFFQSEMTLLKKFGILKTFGRSTFQKKKGFTFDHNKINFYQNKYMHFYKNIDTLSEYNSSDLTDELLDRISELSEDKLISLYSYVRNL